MVQFDEHIFQTGWNPNFSSFLLHRFFSIETSVMKNFQGKEWTEGVGMNVSKKT